MPFMQAWYRCIELAVAIEAVVLSFRVTLYQYTAPKVEHCDLVALHLMVW